ncbi:hypothetical protein XELAEV_18001746mg [Xenopus laevis]|nr:hypothetical protein XELAEV_18001746mg [Xenopus laevis]
MAPLHNSKISFEATFQYTIIKNVQSFICLSLYTLFAPGSNQVSAPDKRKYCFKNTFPFVITVTPFCIVIDVITALYKVNSCLFLSISVDFGLATVGPISTSNGGTLCWMAPEVHACFIRRVHYDCKV